MPADEAHRILDLVRAGVDVPDETIAAALVATGDLTNPTEAEHEPA